MSEEIKEILDRTLDYLEGIDETRNTKILTTNETNILLDYITNLQQKVEQLENIRKEAIEILERHTRYSTGELLNILNKGSEK